MAQQFTNSWLSTNVPGAYPNTVVQSTPVGLGSSGILVIMGEADGGNSYQNVALSSNYFTPDQLDQVRSTYISGQIVDAFAALTAPSNDSNITGTANQVYIVKTNQATKASAIIPTNYGTLADLNWGVAGNNYSYTISSLAAEVAPVLQGSTITTFGSALNGLSFNIRLNGGASTVVGPITGSPANVTALVTELNTLLPSGISASAGTASNSIALTIAADSAAWGKGWGKSFELIDSTPGDLAALGLVSGLVVSSQEPEVEAQISNTSTGLNEIYNVVPDIQMQIGYAGTSATLTINATTLSTTVAGGSGGNLSISLSQYSTCADLAAYISSQTGYTAICAPSAQQASPSTLDQVSAIGIAATLASATPGRIKDARYSFSSALNTSVAVSFTATATAGLPAPTSGAAYLTGGARGNTLAADIINGLDQMAGIQCNIIIPLFSQDATADIAAGLTGSGSTYTIAAINAATKNHCIEYSTPKLKKNRICILSYNGAYSACKSAAQGLGNYRCSLTMQPSTQVNSLGVITVFQPWYAAVIAAGMQAGGFYKSITNKLANVISFSDQSGFDSGNPGDVEDALSAGLLFMTKNTAGNSWVCDQTTYGVDSNFVYNSIQAVYDADILSLDLAASFQAAFVGQSLADVSAASALGYLSQKMAQYKSLKLIAASSDAPLGYKDPSIQIVAPVMTVNVNIKLATAILFIPINISISQITQSA